MIAEKFGAEWFFEYLLLCIFVSYMEALCKQTEIDKSCLMWDFLKGDSRTGTRLQQQD